MKESAKLGDEFLRVHIDLCSAEKKKKEKRKDKQKGYH